MNLWLNYSLMLLQDSFCEFWTQVIQSSNPMDFCSQYQDVVSQWSC